ncbi:MAG TPA: endonuclease/exonuclease/phosphatase family protein [Streptosporangiaceae bacterium]|nr:endonuclease/exonuclease/phosphatase family protein [Streptosporangiaceae bacterium]
MLSPRLEWAVAGCAAGWAVARLAAADRFRPVERVAVPLLALTPHAAAAAALASLSLRGKGPSATAAVAAAAMAGVVAPRAIPRRQPAAGGPVLSVLTVNLLAGGAAGPELVELVRRTGADVLFLQEITDEAAGRLKRAGLSDLLQHEMLDIEGYRYRGSAIYATYPLREGLTIGPSYASQPTARLELPDGRSVQLVCVHPHPPMPPWSLPSAPRWRGELAALPPPGDPPVVLAGDFNATPDHAQFRRLLRLGHVDAAGRLGKGLVPTWGPEPRGRPPLLAFDHVLLDPRCEVLASSVHPMVGSDHRALFVRFRLPS